MSLENIYKIIVFIFTVGSLAAIGLESNLHESIKTRRSPRFVALTMVWGWIAGPAFRLSDHQDHSAIGASRRGIAADQHGPGRPYYPLMVTKSSWRHGLRCCLYTFGYPRHGSATAIDGTAADQRVSGEHLGARRAAPPDGIAADSDRLAINFYAPPLAAKLHPVVKRLGFIFFLATAVLTFVLYGRQMLMRWAVMPSAHNSCYSPCLQWCLEVGFGLNRISEAPCPWGCAHVIRSRVRGLLWHQDPDPGIFVMLVLVVPLAVIVALIAARIFAKQAVMADAGGQAATPA